MTSVTLDPKLGVTSRTFVILSLSKGDKSDSPQRARKTQRKAISAEKMVEKC